MARGAPVGVGESLKRTADRIVKLGTDIPNAPALYLSLLKTQTGVQLFYIEDELFGKYASRIPNDLKPVKGTMKLHQIVSKVRGTIDFRDITCVCRTETRVIDCRCFDIESFTFRTDADGSHQVDSMHVNGDCRNVVSSPYHRPDVISDDDVSKWCIAMYRGLPYPGIITSVEEMDIQVNCMHHMGANGNSVNRFRCPPSEDIGWFDQTDIVTLISEPVHADRRAYKIEEDIWMAINKSVGLTS